MGNVFQAVQDFPRTSLRCSGAQTQRSDLQELLVMELSGLHKVELWRVQWGLSQNLLQGSPPIPRHWLQSADASNTASIMLKCYHEDGALNMLAVVQNLIGCDSRLVRQKDLHYPVAPLRPELVPKPDLDFVKTRRRELISRMQSPDTILDTLQKSGILNATNREAVNIYAVLTDKNRALVDLVIRKGQKARDVFYQALSISEPFLLQELEDSPNWDESPSESSVLTEMLDFLVSDELRTFQWLVSDHMTEIALLFGGELLQRADRLTTERLLVKNLGLKHVASITTNLLLKIVPVLGVCLPQKVVMSQISSDITEEKDVDSSEVEVTPEVSEDGNLFRLRCQKPGVFHCSQTGLKLEGFGDVVYQMVPWDMDFLSSQGLRPAGPLFRFILLTGRFHRLHLPHSQLISDGSQHFLSVAHVTGDSMNLITPSQVKDSHVIINISGFSCFGLVTSEGSSPISGLVLVFSQPSDSSLFVLLLPRNVCLRQVMTVMKQRIKAEYVEAIPECELIPNQTYRLSGHPSAFIQPETSKFVNFSDYNNFLPSFQVQLPDGVRGVELQLTTCTIPFRFIGWLFGPSESVVWHRVITLRAAISSVCAEGASDSVQVVHLLIDHLNCLGLEDLKIFQHFLSLQADPIPFCRLEGADRTRTVDLMVQQYHPEGAVEVTRDVLRKMKRNHLADLL